MISKQSKIYVAGHSGMVGSACLNELKKSGYKTERLGLKNMFK